MPAPGQGTIAVQVRADDERTHRLAAAIGDAGNALALEAEQAVVSALGGGCQTPIGAFAALAAEGDRLDLQLQAIVISLDGTPRAAGVRVGSRPRRRGARPARGGGPARPGRGGAACRRDAEFIAASAGRGFTTSHQPGVVSA